MVRVLADILRESGKEKVTRIIIATLRVKKKLSKNEPWLLLPWAGLFKRRFMLSQH